MTDISRGDLHVTYNNVKGLIEDSQILFREARYRSAGFLAMTAIEEVGKLWLLRFSHLAGAPIVGLTKMVRDHTGKALEAAAWCLQLNAGADRRHGKNPSSKVSATDGIALLSRSTQWMRYRNACIYSDDDLAAQFDRAHSYYFICMALEVLAEETVSETVEGDAVTVWKDIIRGLEDFMEQYKTDISHLAFLAQPDHN